MSESTAVTKEDLGKACIYIDPLGRRYDALITNVFGPQCINLIFVNDVEGQTDSYGQKIRRVTSLMHGEIQQAHGNYWMLPGEVRERDIPKPVDSTEYGKDQ